MIAPMIRKSVVLSMLIAGIFTLSFAQTTTSTSNVTPEEKITIGTYYPSPRGVYKEVQLFPHVVDPDETDCYKMENKGVIIVTPDFRALVCNGIGQWVPLGGGDFWRLVGTNLYPANHGWRVGKGTDTPNFKTEVNGQANAQGLCIDYDGTKPSLCKDDWPVIDCTPNCIVGFDMRLQSGQNGYAVCGPCLPTPEVSPPPWLPPPPRVTIPPGAVGKYSVAMCSTISHYSDKNCGDLWVTWSGVCRSYYSGSIIQYTGLEPIAHSSACASMNCQPGVQYCCENCEMGSQWYAMSCSASAGYWLKIPPLQGVSKLYKCSQ